MTSLSYFEKNNYQISVLVKILFLFNLLQLGVSNSFLTQNFSTYIMRFSILVMVVLWSLMKLFDRKNFVVKYNNLFLAFLVFLIYQLVSVSFALSPSLSLSFIYDRVWVLLMLFMYLQIQDNIFRTQVFHVILFLSGLLIFNGFFQQYVTLPELRNQLQLDASNIFENRFLTRLNSTEMSSVFIYSNIFSIFCSLILILVLSLKTKLSIKLFLSLIVFAGLISAQSKGAFVCLSLLVPYGIFLYAKTKKIKIYVVVLLLVVFALVTFVPMINDVFYDSFFIRIGYWLSLLDATKENLIGYGVNNFKEIYFQFMRNTATEVQKAHNDHLQQLLEVGVLGFVIYGIYLWVQIKSALSIKYDKLIFFEYSSNRYLIYAFTLFIFVFILCNGVLRVGSVDIEKYQIYYILSITVWFVITIKFSFKHIGLHEIGLNFLVLYFILHSSLDFPFYDHYLLFFYILMFFIFKSEYKEKRLGVYLKRGLLSLLLVVNLIVFAHYSKIYNLTIQINASKTAEDLKNAYFQVKNEKMSLSLWESLLNKIKRYEQVEGHMLNHLKLSCLNQLIELRPKASSLIAQKGELVQDPQEKLKLYELAMMNYPMQPRYTYLYAYTLYQNGEKEKSKPYYKKALNRHRYVKELATKQWDFELHCLNSEQVNEAVRVLKL